MDKGIPDCPDCGGKGMCDSHKLDYLYYEYDKARNALRAEMKKQKEKLIANIKQITESEQKQKGTQNEKL